MEAQKFHAVMFPWLAFGHFTPFLHLSNQLAERGHRVSFLVPNKALSHLQQQNAHPDLITLYPLTIPSVDGLPPGAESASDVPFPSHTHLATAFDLTRTQVETLLTKLTPDFVLHDFSYWLPAIAKKLGIKSVFYHVVSATCSSMGVTPGFKFWNEEALLTDDPDQESITPPGFPAPEVKLRGREVTAAAGLRFEFGKGITFMDRLFTTMQNTDALCFRTCYEVEGMFVDYYQNQWNKPVMMTGLAMPEEDGSSSLDPKWADWLNGFGAGTVVYCALGTQIELEKDQFQELVLGFESTGLPFLVVLKPPVGSSSVEEALPDGFMDRVKGRGVVYGGWVQQTLILNHPSVGCFVSHCGFGSIWEGLLTDCQLVLLPFIPDQIIHTRFMTLVLKVAVEVEKRKPDGWIPRENLSKAIEMAMDPAHETGSVIRKNHLTYKQMLSKEGLMSSYIDKFVEDLKKLKKAAI